MRVLHVYKTYYPNGFGGVPEVIKQLCIGMRAHGIESEVFTMTKNPPQSRIKFGDHFVYCAKIDFEILSTPFSFQSIEMFRKYAKNFDIIHYHYPYPFGDLLKLLSGLERPSIVTYHSDIVRQRVAKYFYYSLQQYFLNSVTKIVCTSDAYKNSSSVLKRYKDKTVSVTLGLSSENRLTPQKELTQIWQRALPEKFFLFLGVMRKYKGLYTLIRAAKSMQGNIVICGDGPELKGLKNYVKINNMTNVFFTGRVDEQNKAALLDLCTGLVLPSHLRSEAFGLVLLEAAMRSKPLISTELNTATSFVNKNGVTGVVVPKEDSYALRDAMELILQNPKLAKKMGLAARARYEKYFTGELMCAEYSSIYREAFREFHSH